MSITYRSVKGSRLTSAEVDANFSYLDQEGNRIIVDAGFTVTGQDVVINSGYEWVILGVDYINSTDVTVTIPYASSGMKRTDLIVANTSNSFERVVGIESATNPATPPMQGKIVVTVIDVTDGTIGGGSSTIIGTEFQKKIYDQSFGYDASGVVDFDNCVIPIDPLGRTEIRLNNTSITGIAGFDLSLISGNPYADTPHLGKKFRLINNTGHNVILKHISVLAEIFITSKDSQNIVLPTGETIEFIYNGTMYDSFRSWTDFSNLKKSFLVLNKAKIALTSADLNWYVLSNIATTVTTAAYVDSGTTTLLSAIDNNTGYMVTATADFKINNILIDFYNAGSGVINVGIVKGERQNGVAFYNSNVVNKSELYNGSLQSGASTSYQHQYQDIITEEDLSDNTLLAGESLYICFNSSTAQNGASGSCFITIELENL